MTRHFLNASINCNCTKCAQEEKEDTEEEKKKKELQSLKAELRGKSHEELDKIKESLLAELHDLKDKKKESKEAKRKKYSVLGYDNALFNSNATAGDCFLEDLGSVD